MHVLTKQTNTAYTNTSLCSKQMYQDRPDALNS